LLYSFFLFLCILQCNCGQKNLIFLFEFIDGPGGEKVFLCRPCMARLVQGTGPGCHLQLKPSPNSKSTTPLAITMDGTSLRRAPSAPGSPFMLTSMHIAKVLQFHS
jgi:hypothetical protein